MSQADGHPVAFRSAGWRKSSHSNPSGDCVQMATLPGDRVAMRNSRFPSGAVLVFGANEMSAFVRGIKNGEFDSIGN
jgi:hypothetical protein